MKDQIEKLGIIGAGQMGTGIAQVALGRGFTVQLSDCSEDALSRARALIDKGFAKWVEKSKMDAGQAEQALGRLTLLHELEALQSAEMVIEAASEQEALKLDLFCRLSNICSPDCILATNTSSVPVTRIASVVDGPHRVIGMHFMNPVPLMQLVEVIRALQSDDATTQTVCAVAKRLGKTPVEVKDGFGFVANRILLPMINEAIYVRYEQL
ncbi:MAG: 3-hydroxyacyl-CoA dehydrogenase NAD-binding domain-containing protein, partial [Pseudomonadota bacterium]